MKQTLIGIVSFLMLVAFPHIGNAGDITYTIQNYLADQNGATLSGTITTDGVIGNLAQGDILSWSYTITGDGESPVTVTSSDPFAGVEVDGSVVASATSITIAVPPVVPENQLILDASTGSTAVELGYVRLADDLGGGGGYRGDALGTTAGWDTTNPSMGGTNPWVIAEVSSVPEPSSLTLAGLGLACTVTAGVARKSQNRGRWRLDG
jgi:hypothetical protein